MSCVKWNSDRSVFDASRALKTIQELDFIRLCGSEDERRAMHIIARRLDELGVAWSFHTFRDRWVEPDDPHLLVRGRKITIRPAMEFAFQYGFDFMANDGLTIDVSAPLAPASDSAGKIAVAAHFDPEQPVQRDALAQVMAFPFDPEMEPHLWAQPWDAEPVPAAFAAPADIPFVLESIGEPATLRWKAAVTQREFRNLVAEIPGAKRPDEIVLMGAHIDSFPGTVGSSDDAAGCAVLVEAARWFAANPPARTVRLVWFTGEELDRRGSRRYVAERVNDANSVKLMVCVDHGYEMHTAPASVYVSKDEMQEWVRQRLNLQGTEVFISESKWTDAGAFTEIGIPAFMASGKSKQRAHLPDDRPENIDLDKLQLLGTLNLEAAIVAASELTADS